MNKGYNSKQNDPKKSNTKITLLEIYKKTKNFGNCMFSTDESLDNM